MSTTPTRVAIIDIGRTVAIVAMAIFHFTYDLEMFGFAPSGTMASIEWRMFAWIIAGSFLFLSGVSLVLATANGPIKRDKYLRRLAMIGAAALAVTIGTYVAMGQAFVRFGILHHMFLASLLGLLFLKRPFWIAGLLGAAILTLPHLPFWPIVGSNSLIWLGKSRSTMPPMVDYVPLLPWFGMFLLGMSAAQLAQRLGLWGRLAGLVNPETKPARILSWPGKHSLAVYLLHQPILFGCVFLARSILS